MTVTETEIDNALSDIPAEHFHFPASKKLSAWLIENDYLDRRDNSIVGIRAAAAAAIEDGTLSAAKFYSLFEDQVMTKSVAEKLFSGPDGGGSAATFNVSGGTQVRVKAPSTQYNDVRYIAKHARLGTEIADGYGSYASRPSQMSMAKAGVLLKQTARRAGLPTNITEHENELWREMLEADEWAAFDGNPEENKIYAPGQVKALVDDSVSGGLEAVPIEFDADLVGFPLLQNELFPLVDLKPVSRGRRIEGASMANPTASWGGGDNSEATLFNTANMIAPIDTTIHTVDIALEVGLDMMQDSPANVAAELLARCGRRLGNELDRVISRGGGVTEPQGVMLASGTTSVSFASAAVNVTKLMSLLFGVGKAYKQEAGSNFVFCSNETSHARARGVATGVSGDTRLVLGMDVESYNVFNHPWKIAGILPNTEHFAGCLGTCYRMYRRLGMSVKWETGGKTLTSKNLAYLMIRARFGGRVVDPAGFAVTTNSEA